MNSPRKADPGKPTFFKSGHDFRRWLTTNHARCRELHVGFYRKKSGRPGMSYAEAVDEALCFGWIDGVMRKIDDASYSHRFTPRRPKSIWSNTNVRHVERLSRAGRMHSAGLAAFAARKEKTTGVYSFEQTSPIVLPREYEKQFRANAPAWEYFSQQAPWYRRLMIFKITSAKREETRQRWLARVVAESAAKRRVL
jgi:uncharacterized protein YdeI (YjbR/CyaY-like superfamily)